MSMIDDYTDEQSKKIYEQSQQIASKDAEIAELKMHVEKKKQSAQEDFATLKMQIGNIFNQNISFSKDGKAVEGNPAVHAITEYVDALLSAVYEGAEQWEYECSEKDKEVAALKGMSDSFKKAKDAHISILRDEINELKASLAEKKGMQWVNGSEKRVNPYSAQIRDASNKSPLLFKKFVKDGNAVECITTRGYIIHFSLDEIECLDESAPLTDAKQEDKTTVDRFDLLNKAIDVQYAKQEAIDFAVWFLENVIATTSEMVNSYGYMVTPGDGNYRTAEQVYDLYMEQKKGGDRWIRNSHRGCSTL